MREQRWLRIIPVALVMYTISYVDRTNISLALDPTISSMMKDLFMDDRMKGEAAGIFFFGYVLLQIPGGYWATRWSARKIISLFLISWGVCAVGCGLARTFRQFEVMRFLLGVAESGVFPATLVLLANWFPRSERARANAYWTLCQPLAVAASAPFTGWLLGAYGWQKMLILEGMLPFLWLPVWWFCIRDHPREAKWVSAEERDFLETTLRREAAALEPPQSVSLWGRFCERPVLVLIAMYFLQNCAAYGCMTFFTSSLKGRAFTGLQYGILFGIPYALTAVLMVLNSRHSDKTRERRGHVALAYLPERHQPHSERGAARAFLGFLRLHVPGHSRPVHGHGPLLVHPERNPPPQRGGARDRFGQCLRQSGRVCGTLHRRLAQAGIPEPDGCFRCAGRGIAAWRRARLPAAESGSLRRSQTSRCL